MNPIPQAPIPTGTLFLNGYLELLAVASILVIVGMTLWVVRSAIRERVRLMCPVRLRRVRVLFRLAPDGKRADVLRCSVFGRRPITCGKVCLHHTAHV